MGDDESRERTQRSQSANLREKRTDTEIYTVSGSKWTFEDEPVRAWVEDRLSGRVLNACAGKSKLNHDGEVVRNDIDESIDADYHQRCRDLPDILEIHSFDTIVFDPPWSVHKANEHYNGEQVAVNRVMEEALDELLAPEGNVLTISYMAQGMPWGLGYARQEVAIFDPYGRRKPFFGVRDRRRNQMLHTFAESDAVRGGAVDS